MHLYTKVLRSSGSRTIQTEGIQVVSSRVERISCVPEERHEVRSEAVLEVSSRFAMRWLLGVALR